MEYPAQLVLLAQQALLVVQQALLELLVVWALLVPQAQLARQELVLLALLAQQVLLVLLVPQAQLVLLGRRALLLRWQAQQALLVP